MEALKHKVSNIIGGKSKGLKRSYKHLPDLGASPVLSDDSPESCTDDVAVPSASSGSVCGLEVDAARNMDNNVSGVRGGLKKKLKTFRSFDDLLHDAKAAVMKSKKKGSYSQLPSSSEGDGNIDDVHSEGACSVGSDDQKVEGPEFDCGLDVHCDNENDKEILDEKVCSNGPCPDEELSPECGGSSSSCFSDGENRLGSPGSEKFLPIHDREVEAPGSAESLDNKADPVTDKTEKTLTDESIKAKDNAKFKVPMMHKSHSTRRLSLTGSFELPRFRKRRHGNNKENDDDNISVQSLDVSGRSAKKKSKKSLLRVSASLANLISPNRNKGDSDGFKVPSSPLRQVPTSPYRPPQPSPAKRPVQLTWQDSFGSGRHCNQTLSQADIKRQEAIYELYQGEKAMMEDLVNVTKLYRDSLVTLGLLSSQDVNTLFGNIDSLVPVHRDLVQRLQDERQADGTTHSVGGHLLEWADSLTCYVDYCANQIRAKAIFDEIKTQSAVDDFFQRCLASPFSRKLDLWTLLDGAKARFIKYPLLIRSIIKYTDSDCEEAALLEKAVKRLEETIRDADHQAGLARCNHSKSSLVYLFEDQRVPEIDGSTSLVCSGCMKNTKGSKLYVFVFDKVVVVSRSTTQNGRQSYQVYRQPIPISDLVVEDLPDGEVKLGSFRNAFGQGGQTGKNLIRISFRDGEKGQAHTLIANDEHDKRQWVQSFQKVTSVLLHTSPSSSLSSSSSTSSTSSSSSSSTDSKSKDR